jgi:K(+)-stimulated pyrophosphate-energized sodium pump
MPTLRRRTPSWIAPALFAIVCLLIAPTIMLAQDAPVHTGGEASLVLPDLSISEFFGFDGRTLLMGGLLICALGLMFGLVTYMQLRDLPVHPSMKEVSELIWESCKTYLFTQGRFLLILEAFIGTIILIYFGYFQHFDTIKVIIILLFSIVGIAGSYAVAWYGIRVNTFANSRTAFASLRGNPFPPATRFRYGRASASGWC